MSISDNLQDIRRQNSLSSSRSTNNTISTISADSTLSTVDVTPISYQDLVHVRTFTNERKKWSEHVKKKIIFEMEQLVHGVTQLPTCCSQECVKNFTFPEIQQISLH